MTTTAVDAERNTAPCGPDEARWRALGCATHLVVTSPAALPAALEACERVVGEVDLAASRFRPDSEIMAVNNACGAWTAVSPLFLELLAVALEAARWTDGAVDPTVGRSLLDLGYDRTFRSVPASGPALTVVLRPAVGWRTIEVADGAVRIPDGVLLDLGATAKGFAADRCAAAAAAATGCGVLVSLGGDVAVAGPVRVSDDGAGWPILVTDLADVPLTTPRGDDGQIVMLPVGGIATSGTSSRRWSRGGSEVHHLIDPTSGRPALSPWRTVSVVAVTCADANAASTGAVVMGDSAAAWLVGQGMAARLVAHDGTVTRVGGWPEPRAESVNPS